MHHPITTMRLLAILLCAAASVCSFDMSAAAAPAQQYAQAGVPPNQPGPPGNRRSPQDRGPQRQRATPQVPLATAPNHRRWDWNNYRPGAVPPLWNQYRNTFSMRSFQRNEHALRRYHGPTYVPPSGWRYQRWVYGQILPSFFWTQSYWIFDYWAYDLVDPPYGFVWVRFGPDAILVDVHTGLILRVVYGVFFF